MYFIVKTKFYECEKNSSSFSPAEDFTVVFALYQSVLIFECWNHYFRMSRIQSISFGNHSTGGTIVWNHFYVGNESSTTNPNATEMFGQFWRLLHHRFGTRFIWFAISNMVNWKPTVDIFLVIKTKPCETCPKLLKLFNFFAYSSNRFPFDWTNPIGYSIAIFLEYIIWGYENFVVTSTLALGIGAYLFAIFATKEIQRGLHLINDKAHQNGHQSNELKILITDFIFDHGALKQLSTHYTLYSKLPMIFIQDC